ncbi:Cytochrome P450 [Quillaja saponaria]|uniref:Cytochrome P450 n=1 Tax=Quillaja saponaria TaxID=32244 RepID=A0AAD7LMH3_QUISA|nr:Cytochrome P450 [Quillaja saponaria]
MIKGVWAIPINLPFTRYNNSLRESAWVQDMVKELVHEKRVQIEQQGASPHQDLITFLLSIWNEDGKEVLSENEIVHNVILTVVAGYDASFIAITFLIRILANEPTVYAGVLQGESLTWEDLAKMKYIWRLAMETLRMFPPIFGSFRKALTDTEYNGYVIPKGLQILWFAPMTHMDNSIFPEPSKFNPSRFENQASIPPYSFFITFGGGSRMCPGYRLQGLKSSSQSIICLLNTNGSYVVTLTSLGIQCQNLLKDYRSKFGQGNSHRFLLPSEK